MALWLGYALGDMLLFGLAALLAKSGVKKNNSNLAATLWGIVIFVLIFAKLYLAGAVTEVFHIGAGTWLFLVLSGLALGGALMCLFRSLRTGQSIKIVPVFLSNVILTMLVRIPLFHHTYGWKQIVAMVLFVVGTSLVALGGNAGKKSGYVWLWYALSAAVLASVSTLLAEYGACNVDKYMNYGVRVLVALTVTAFLAAAVGGKGLRSMSFLDGLIICGSAVALGASRVCYHRALALGPDGIITHMDRLGVLAVLALGCIFLRERLSVRAILGYAFIVGGVFVILL